MIEKNVSGVQTGTRKEPIAGDSETPTIQLDWGINVVQIEASAIQIEVSVMQIEVSVQIEERAMVIEATILHDGDEMNQISV